MDPLAQLALEAWARYFWPKVKKTAYCWQWTGAINDSGYGKLKVEGRVVLAHRFSYALHHGPIPCGKVVMHACDNRVCVRPDHLKLGSVKANTRDMVRKGRHGLTKRKELEIHAWQRKSRKPL